MSLPLSLYFSLSLPFSSHHQITSRLTLLLTCLHFSHFLIRGKRSDYLAAPSIRQEISRNLTALLHRRSTMHVYARVFRPSLFHFISLNARSAPFPRVRACRFSPARIGTSDVYVCACIAHVGAVRRNVSANPRKEGKLSSFFAGAPSRRGRFSLKYRGNQSPARVAATAISRCSSRLLRERVGSVEPSNAIARSRLRSRQ